MWGQVYYAEGDHSEVKFMLWQYGIKIIWHSTFYNISMHTLNILSEEVNCEERFRLVLKNYTLLRSFMNSWKLCIMLFMNCSSLQFNMGFLLDSLHFFQVQGCMFLCAWSCAASSLWMPSFIMTYDYDTLIFAPVPLKKKNIWLHQIFVVACGIWFLTKVWTQAPCNLPSYFAPWNLEPDIQIFSQIFRNLDLGCPDSTYYLIAPQLSACFSSFSRVTLTFLLSVEGSKTEEPVRHPRVLIWHTKLNSTSCKLL